MAKYLIRGKNGDTYVVNLSDKAENMLLFLETHDLNVRGFDIEVIPPDEEIFTI